MITETKSGIATFWGSFSEPLIFIFGKDLVSLIFKSLLTFTAFVNYEGPYFAEGFLLNLRPCFDIAFAQLGVIPRTTNKFVEIAAAAECYLITNHVKNIKEAAVWISLPVKLADGRMSVKKEKNYSHLIYNIFSLGKMAAKSFSWINMNLRSYLENLAF